MTKPQVTIYDCETGKETVRDANADEIAQLKIDAENIKTRKAAEAQQEAARQAVLERLGLTADEAKLLLG